MRDAELLEICSLPTAFRKSGLSWHELVERSPYASNPKAFTEDLLASFLNVHSDLIELWLAWSADKRSTPSPFFRRSGSRYELGYVERGGRFGPSEFFDQPARPCARFILQELAVQQAAAADRGRSRL
jgi:hypothetical protein